MRTLKIAAAYYKPLVYPCSLYGLEPRKGCEMPGIAPEILHYALTKAKIPYQLWPFSTQDHDWGTFNNGTWSGVLGMVLDGSLDTVSATYFQVPIRMEYFTYTYPIEKSYTHFLVAKTSHTFSESSGVVFRNFSPGLWGSILATVIICALVVVLMSGLSGQRFSKLAHAIFSYFCLIIDQFTDSNTWANTTARKLLYLWVGFFAMMFLNLYQNSLLTHLLLPRIKQPFKDSYDLIRLVKNKEYTFVSQDASYAFFQKVLFDNSTVGKMFQEALEVNPVRIEKDFNKLLQLVKNHKHIWSLDEYSTKLLTAEHCELTEVKVLDFSSEWHAFMFRKNDPIVPAISEAIATSYNFIEHIVKKYDDYLQSNCTRVGAEMPLEGLSKLRLITLAGTMVLFCTGCILGVGTFACEKLFLFSKVKAKLVLHQRRAARGKNIEMNREYIGSAFRPKNISVKPADNYKIDY